MNQQNQTQMRPEIGMLIRMGRPVFYAFVAGVYREGSVQHLTSLLETLA